MKIIFLDIDGVLNSQAFLHETLALRDALCKRDLLTRDSEHWAAMLDAEAIKVLNEVVKKTGAKFVLSSSWRIGHTVPEMQGLLNSKGFIGELIDRTPFRSPAPPYKRGNEIQAWIDDHSVDGFEAITNFAIVDDDSDMEHLKHKLVQTEWATGLLPKHLALLLQQLES